MWADSSSESLLRPSKLHADEPEQAEGKGRLSSDGALLCSQGRN